MNVQNFYRGIGKDRVGHGRHLLYFSATLVTPNVKKWFELSYELTFLFTHHIAVHDVPLYPSFPLFSTCWSVQCFRLIHTPTFPTSQFLLIFWTPSCYFYFLELHLSWLTAHFLLSVQPYILLHTAPTEKTPTFTTTLCIYACSICSTVYYDIVSSTIGLWRVVNYSNLCAYL